MRAAAAIAALGAILALAIAAGPCCIAADNTSLACLIAAKLYVSANL